MEMLMFDIDKKHAQPIYQQLYDNIKNSIIKGVLREGEKLRQNVNSVNICQSVKPPLKMPIYN